MDDVDTHLVSVRADTAAFASDVAAMRAALDPLASAAERTGERLAASLAHAAETGTLSFDALKKAALSALDSIAASAVKAGVSAVLGNGGGGLLASLAGAPGRATGGPVSPGRAYLVGERGPELFVPTSSGVVAATPAPTPAREVRVAITINAPAGTAPTMLQQSSRQLARAVKAALNG